MHDEIKNMLQQLPQVEKVVVKTVTTVFTYIKDGKDNQARREVYELERKIMKQFPGQSFDFNVGSYRGTEG